MFFQICSIRTVKSQEIFWTNPEQSHSYIYTYNILPYDYIIFVFEVLFLNYFYKQTPKIINIIIFTIPSKTKEMRLLIIKDRNTYKVFWNIS